MSKQVEKEANSAMAAKLAATGEVGSRVPRRTSALCQTSALSRRILTRTNRNGMRRESLWVANMERMILKRMQNHHTSTTHGPKLDAKLAFLPPQMGCPRTPFCLPRPILGPGSLVTSGSWQSEAARQLFSGPLCLLLGGFPPKDWKPSDKGSN